MMRKSRQLEQLTSFAICLVAFAIPFPYIFGSVSILFLAITWLLQADFNNMWINLRQRKVLWIWILFFALHAISYLYSENKSRSMHDLESKLSLLILPVIVGAGIKMDRKLLEKVLLSFILSISAIAAYCFLKAYIGWRETSYQPIWFYHHLVLGLKPDIVARLQVNSIEKWILLNGIKANAVYTAWYTIFSISILLFTPWKHYFKKYTAIKYFFILLQLIFFILLSARLMIFLLFLVVMPCYIIMLVKHRNFPSLARVFMISVVLLMGVFIVVTDNPVKNRYKEILGKSVNEVINRDYHNISEDDFTNFSLRVFLWRIAFENIKEQNLWLFGAGNGDVQDLQNEKIKEYNIKRTVNGSEGKAQNAPQILDANTHNMFVQTILTLGIVGLIVFISLVLSPFAYLLKGQLAFVFIVFNIVSILFMFLESSFQTQAGIVYYSFFTQVACTAYYSIYRNNNI